MGRRAVACLVALVVAAAALVVARTPDADDAPGASPGTTTRPPASPSGAAEVSQAAARADEDVPTRPECQMAPTSAGAPVVCEFGDPASDTVVMLVGDSKLVQWRPAFEVLAQERGWRLVQVTRSACAFADVMTAYRGEAWTTCRQWGRDVLATVLTEQPDLVVTSQRRPEAMVGDDPSVTSVQAMASGLAGYWSQLEDAGIATAVLLDNPGPPPDLDVPTCLQEHPDDVDACAFDTAAGLRASAAPAQRAAAEAVPGVQVLDLTAFTCPRSRCAPVRDGVPVFRQGTHVTASFARSAAPELAASLAGP